MYYLSCNYCRRRQLHTIFHGVYLLAGGANRLVSLVFGTATIGSTVAMCNKERDYALARPSFGYKDRVQKTTPIPKQRSVILMPVLFISRMWPYFAAGK